MFSFHLTREHITGVAGQIGRDDLHELIEICEAELIGRRAFDDGKAAASWLVDGNTANPEFLLKHYIKGIDDGDPMVLDKLPVPQLGGEFAGDDTWDDIVNEELHREPNDDDDTDLFVVYNEHFHNGVEAEIRRMHKAYSEG